MRICHNHFLNRKTSVHDKYILTFNNDHCCNIRKLNICEESIIRYDIKLRVPANSESWHMKINSTLIVKQCSEKPLNKSSQGLHFASPHISQPCSSDYKGIFCHSLISFHLSATIFEKPLY